MRGCSGTAALRLLRRVHPRTLVSAPGTQEPQALGEAAFAWEGPVPSCPFQYLSIVLLNWLPCIGLQSPGAIHPLETQQQDAGCAENTLRGSLSPNVSLRSNVQKMLEGVERSLACSNGLCEGLAQWVKHLEIHSLIPGGKEPCGASASCNHSSLLRGKLNYLMESVLS